MTEQLFSDQKNHEKWGKGIYYLINFYKLNSYKCRPFLNYC